MQYSKIYRLFVFLIAGIFLAACSRPERVQTLNIPEIIQTASTLPLEGTLQEKSSGYIYLRVSNQFVNKLYPLLLANLSVEDRKCLMPDQGPPGPHVSLFYEKDNVQLPSEDINHHYSFTIERMYRINVSRHEEGRYYKKTFYILAIKSPALKQLILHFNPNSPFGDKLHITIAVDNRYNDDSCVIQQDNRGYN